MLHATERPTGPRYLDADIVSRVKNATIMRFRLALQRVLSFLLRNKYFPSVAMEFYDLLVEWKHTDVVAKSTFERAIAAIEFSLPPFKGELERGLHALKLFVHNAGMRVASAWKATGCCT